VLQLQALLNHRPQQLRPAVFLLKALLLGVLLTRVMTLLVASALALQRMCSHHTSMWHLPVLLLLAAMVLAWSLMMLMRTCHKRGRVLAHSHPHGAMLPLSSALEGRGADGVDAMA
jgi:hypothetical protein